MPNVDFAFNQKALDCGIPCFADLLCPLTHAGTYHFAGHWVRSLRVTSVGPDKAQETGAGATEADGSGATKQAVTEEV